MIIICPKCSTRYMVPDSSIGDDGRKVRCNNCHEVWQQFIEDALDNEIDGSVPEVAAESHDDSGFTIALEDVGEEPQTQDIPKAIQPRHEKDVVLKGKAKKRLDIRAYMTGIAAGVTILCLSGVMLVLNNEKLLADYPQFRPLFATIGQDPYGDMRDVIFEQPFAKYSKTAQSFKLGGIIINLSNAPIFLPKAEVNFFDKNGTSLEKLRREISEDNLLKGEATVSFDFTYPMNYELAKHVARVRLDFSPAYSERMAENDAGPSTKSSQSSLLGGAMIGVSQDDNHKDDTHEDTTHAEDSSHKDEHIDDSHASGH